MNDGNDNIEAAQKPKRRKFISPELAKVTASMSEDERAEFMQAFPVHAAEEIDADKLEQIHAREEQSALAVVADARQFRDRALGDIAARFNWKL